MYDKGGGKERGEYGWGGGWVFWSRGREELGRRDVSAFFFSILFLLGGLDER